MPNQCLHVCWSDFSDSLFCSPCGYLLMSLPCVYPVMHRHLSQVWLLFTKYLWFSTFWAPVRIAFIEPLVTGWSLGLVQLVYNNELLAKVIGVTSKLGYLIDGMKPSRDLLPSPMMASNIPDRGCFISLHPRMKETWSRVSS